MSDLQADLDAVFAPLRDDPSATAILSDVDGTLSPIVADPSQAGVLPGAHDALAALASRYAVVGCVSGRPALEARRIVGLDRLVYLGNHGLERLEPGAQEPRSSAALAGHEGDAADFLRRVDAERL